MARGTAGCGEALAGVPREKWFYIVCPHATRWESSESASGAARGFRRALHAIPTHEEIVEMLL